MVGELPKDTQFPTIDRDLPEVAKYTSLLAIKDSTGICNSKILGVFMGMNLRMGINCRP